MLKLIKCEFLKLKRKPLVFISLLLSVFMPLAYAFFLADVNTDVDAVNGVMSSLFQLSAYLLLMPLLVILASNLLFEELDNDTLKNLVTIPINRTKLVLSKMLVLLLFAVGFMAVGGLVNLAVLLFQGWEPVGFWTLFGVGIEEGLIMWVGALPCILLVVLLNKNYIVSVVITFFYTTANYILSMSDAFLTQPFGLNIGTLFPGPLAFRWPFQFYDQSQTSAELADLLERISPYFLNGVQVFGVIVGEAVVFLALIALVNRRQEILGGVIMWNLLKAELLKLRRCQILWVGLVALALCPLVQYGSLLIVEAEYRNPNYDFSTLFENVVWGNTQMFFPISLVMIGSWLIDRESTHDALKSIMTIPVSMPKMLGAKLFWVGIFAVLLGIYSVGVTLITGLTVGLSGLTVEVFFHGGTQIVLAALTTYLVCMPLILIFGQIRGAYLGGSILAFFLGYSMLFFKGGILASIYPFSAALILVGFDMSGYAGTTTAPNPLLAVIGVGIMVLWAVLLLLMSSNKKEIKSRKQANSKGKGKRAVRRKGR